MTLDKSFYRDLIKELLLLLSHLRGFHTYFLIVYFSEEGAKLQTTADEKDTETQVCLNPIYIPNQRLCKS